MKNSLSSVFLPYATTIEVPGLTTPFTPREYFVGGEREEGCPEFVFTSNFKKLRDKIVGPRDGYSVTVRTLANDANVRTILKELGHPDKNVMVDLAAIGHMISLQPNGRRTLPRKGALPTNGCLTLFPDNDLVVDVSWNGSWWFVNADSVSDFDLEKWSRGCQVVSRNS